MMGAVWSALGFGRAAPRETVALEALERWKASAADSFEEPIELDKATDAEMCDAAAAASAGINGRVRLWRGDITTLALDAIVNAARPSLMGGGGVDGAIHRAAGSELKAACRPLGPIVHGEAVVTPAFALPCKWVVHTVGPNRDLQEGEEADRLLAGCYLRSLEEAHKAGARSIAFPSISTGAYRFDMRRATHFACRTARAWLTEHEDWTIVFCVFSPRDEAVYREIMSRFYFVGEGEE